MRNALALLLLLVVGILSSSAEEITIKSPSGAYTAIFDTVKKCPIVVEYWTHPEGLGLYNREGLVFRKYTGLIDCPSPENYSYPWDLGHYMPAAAATYDISVLRDTFLMINCAPQYYSLNRGDWRELETQILNHFARGPPVRVITGVLFDKEPKTIGKEKVAIPSHFWKVVVMKDGTVYGAWLFPNKDNGNHSPKYYEILSSELEKQVGRKLW